ncbi:MAG TPA: hypothetical protein VF720_15115 [Candidatus Eisenbacteria bacterium]
MSRSLAGLMVLSLVLAMPALSGCGASSAPPPPDSAVTPAGQSIETSGPTVEIYTAVERIVVQGFRLDFPKMRNITNLVGFPPEQWDRVINVPLADLDEIQFRGNIDQATFDRIYKNREQFSVNPAEFFNVQVIRTDGTRADLVAVMPKFRGIKDGTVWEMSMAGNPARIDRIVIRR